jgi:hypothetical protein
VLQAVIAAARFVAKVVVLESLMKVPALVDVQELAPVGPGSVPVLGLAVVALLLSAKVMLPLVVLVTVVTAPATVAVALAFACVPEVIQPLPPVHSEESPLIAASRFLALSSWPGVPLEVLIAIW